MKAEREKRAQILEAEGHRQAAILRAEADKQALVLAAEGRREAAFRDSEAREREAQAESLAATTLSEAISKGNMAAVNYMLAEKYVAALKGITSSPNQKVVIVPLEMSKLAGTLGGIGEIVTSAFGNDGMSNNPPPSSPWKNEG